MFWAAVAAQTLIFALYFLRHRYPVLDISYLWYNLIGCAACCGVWPDVASNAAGQTNAHRKSMSNAPVICFGQQPCGFFPKRFLFAKIQTARRLQSEIGGEIVFFYHDSDHDPRETRTILRHRQTNEPAQLNFAVENKIQRKFSPLRLKKIAPDWQGKTLLQLPNYLDHPLIELFKKVID